MGVIQSKAMKAGAAASALYSVSSQPTLVFIHRISLHFSLILLDTHNTLHNHLPFRCRLGSSTEPQAVDVEEVK